MCVYIYSYLYRFLFSEALRSTWYHPSPSQPLAPLPEVANQGSGPAVAFLFTNPQQEQYWGFFRAL